jgi:hypothetical protein
MARRYWDSLLTSSGVSKKEFTSSIAEKILQKQGWTKGSGLGKKLDGKVDPVQIKRRPENVGIGHKDKREKAKKKAAKMWWEDVYNETATKIRSRD